MNVDYDKLRQEHEKAAKEFEETIVANEVRRNQLIVEREEYYKKHPVLSKVKRMINTLLP